MTKKSRVLLEEISEKLDKLLDLNIENSEKASQIENVKEHLNIDMNAATIEIGEESISNVLHDNEDRKITVEINLPEDSEASETNVTLESLALFETQKKDFDLAKKQFNKWTSYILKLSEILGEDLVYDFGEILENEMYNIQKSKQILFLPLKNNAEENYQLIAQVFNAIEFEGEDIKDVSSNHDKINIRTTSDLDYTLRNAGTTKFVTNYAKNILATTFLLSLKQLGQSKKELIQLLTKTISSQGEFQEILKHPSALIDEALELEGDIPFEDWSIHNSKIIKKIQDTTESISKAYKKCLKSIFKVYNEIWVRYKKFTQEVIEMNEEEQTFLETWNSLFTEVLELIIKYLGEELHICPINCEKGDSYNHIYHKPLGEGEPDDELENDSIKSVEAVGFRFMTETELEKSITDLNEVIAEEFKPNQILLQTGVIVVLNK